MNEKSSLATVPYSAMACLSRITTRRIRPVHAVAAVIILTVFLLTRSSKPETTTPLPSIYAYTDGKPPRPWSELLLPASQPTSSPEAVWLAEVAKAHGLPRDVRYYSVRLKPHLNDTRPTISHVGTPFMHGGFRGVNVENEKLKLQAGHTIHVPVAAGPKLSEVDASSLLFGISTSYERVTRSGDAIMLDWTRWMTDGAGATNGASLVLTLRQASEKEVDEVKAKLDAAGIDALVSAEDAEDSPMLYMDLIRQLTVRASAKGIGNDAEKRYLAILDDDAFLPDISEVLKRLSKYDPSKEHYIGMPSERADWIVDRGETVTYGGGAVFLTPPAAVKISQLPCSQSQSSDADQEGGARRLGYPSQWDHLLYDCVANYTKLAMHVLPSFYLPSDEIYGHYFFDYDLGISPLALHRSRNRHQLDPGKATALHPLLGPRAFLQRYQFADNWVLVNGDTLSHYPSGQDVAMLGSPSVQHKNNELRAAAVVPLDPNLYVDDSGRDPKEWAVVTWAGSRRIWKLVDARVDASGEVWQAYVRQKGDPGQYTNGRLNEDKAGSEYVIVLRWEGLAAASEAA